MANRNFTLTSKLYYFLLTLASIAFITPASFSQNASPNLGLGNQLLGQQQNSIQFIENKGQWPSQIVYKADVPGGQMLATPDGMIVGKYNPASLQALEAYLTKREEIGKGLH